MNGPPNLSLVQLERIREHFDKRVEDVVRKRRPKQPCRIIYLEDDSIDITIFERTFRDREVIVECFLTMKDLDRFVKLDLDRNFDLMIIDYNSAFYIEIVEVRRLIKTSNIIITSGAPRQEGVYDFFPFIEKNYLTSFISELIRL